MKNTPGEHMEKLLFDLNDFPGALYFVNAKITSAMAVLASAGSYLLRESDLSEASWAAVATLLACYNAIENEQ